MGVKQGGEEAVYVRVFVCVRVLSCLAVLRFAPRSGSVASGQNFASVEFHISGLLSRGLPSTKITSPDSRGPKDQMSFPSLPVGSKLAVIGGGSVGVFALREAQVSGCQFIF